MPKLIDIPGHGEIEFPDSMSDGDIAAAAKRLTAPAEPTAPVAAGPHVPVAGRGTQLDVQKSADVMTDALPMLGGAAGAFAAGAPGAAAGGMIGTDLQARINGRTPTTGEVVTSGVTQGALEGVGGLASNALTAGGARLYQSVAKPAKAILEKYPTVIHDAIDAGVSIGKRGLAKAEGLLSQAGQATKDTIARAEAAGAKPVTMRPVLKSLSRVEQKVGKQPLREVDLGTIRSIRDRALTENPNPIPLTQAQEMKQSAQRVASDGYNKIARGADVNSVPLDANMAIAGGLKDAIERRVPEVAGLNQRTQKLIGVKKMTERAAGRTSNNAPIGLGMNALIAGGAGGATGLASGDRKTGAATALTILALTNPAIASRLAIGADRLAPLASHAPQAGRLAALLAQMGPR